MLLEGKRGLIVGIANKRSIAWGIAQSVAREGARLAVTYQGERLESRVRTLAEELIDPVILPLDVTNDDEMDTAAKTVQEKMGGLDFMVHAVAFALREELDGEFVDTSREGFRIAHDISAFSLTALAKRAVPLMGESGSIITLSYLGGERVVPNYNVMGVAKAALEMSVRYLAVDLGPKGIRVNAISAGPIKTLASSGVHGISKMLAFHRTHAPPEAQHRPSRSRRYRGVSGLGSLSWHHGRSDIRGRRLQRARNRLSTVMRFVVTDDIFETFPDVRIGVVVARGITTLSGVRVDLSDVLVTAQETVRTVRTALAGTNVIDHPRIRCWREAYRSFGAKLKKYPSSIENLVRRNAQEGAHPPGPSTRRYLQRGFPGAFATGGRRRSRQHRRGPPSDARLGERASGAPTRRSRGACRKRCPRKRCRGAQGRGAMLLYVNRAQSRTRSQLGAIRAQVEKVSRRSAAPKEPWRSRIVIFLV